VPSLASCFYAADRPRNAVSDGLPSIPSVAPRSASGCCSQDPTEPKITSIFQICCSCRNFSRTPGAVHPTGSFNSTYAPPRCEPQRAFPAERFFDRKPFVGMREPHPPASRPRAVYINCWNTPGTCDVPYTVVGIGKPPIRRYSVSVAREMKRFAYAAAPSGPPLLSSCAGDRTATSKAQYPAIDRLMARSTKHPTSQGCMGPGPLKKPNGPTHRGHVPC
jgi:hypothetical protein